MLIEGHQDQEASCQFESVLHRSAIFSVTHTLTLSPDSSFHAERQANLDKSWGIVLLIRSLTPKNRASLDGWWSYAHTNHKRVFLCLIQGGPADVNNDGILLLLLFIIYIYILIICE